MQETRRFSDVRSYSRQLSDNYLAGLHWEAQLRDDPKREYANNEGQTESSSEQQLSKVLLNRDGLFKVQSSLPRISERNYDLSFVTFRWSFLFVLFVPLF